MRPRHSQLMSEHTIINTRLMSERAHIIAAVVMLFAPAPAFALQPLDEFLAAAKSGSPDRLEARAAAETRAAEERVAWSRLFPRLSAEASYTRNQQASIAQFPSGSAVIVAEEQKDASFTLTVPLIDFSAWQQIAAAGDQTSAAEARAGAVALDVEQLIARAYYQLVAAEALKVAAARSFAVSEDNLTFLTERNKAGLTSELDLKRAAAEVEKNRQNMADAELAVQIARRSLRSATDLEPTVGSPLLEATLDAPPALDESVNVATIRAAEEEAEAARSSKRAAWGALLPSISARGTERFTNAAGFGTSPYWTVSVVAGWQLDIGAIAALDVQQQLIEQAEARAERTRRQARDRIHTAWHTVEAQRAKSRAARAQLDASTLAASLAKERYRAGTATLLDVITADRDLFSAETARIQADADLIFARAQLQLASGSSLSKGGAP